MNSPAKEKARGDSSHPQELATVTVTAQRRVPSEFSSYISFPNGQPGTIASFKDVKRRG